MLSMLSGFATRVVWIWNPDNMNIRIFNPFNKLYLRITNADTHAFRIVAIGNELKVAASGSELKVAHRAS